MPKITKREEKRTPKVVIDETPAGSTSPSTVYFNVEFAPRRFLTYSRFDDQDWVHVREYLAMGERVYPSKKGVAFTPTRLRALIARLPEIDEQLKEQRTAAAATTEPQEVSFKTHLGAGIYAGVHSKFNGVDLRRYWAPAKQTSIVPTKSGIYLPSAQWTALKEKLDELAKVHPELEMVEECFHQNQMGFLDCRECLPFGWAIKGLNEQ